MSDISSLLGDAKFSFEKLEGSRILLAGGTGFVGNWLLFALALASQRHNIQLTLLVRDFDKARAILSQFDSRQVSLVSVDQIHPGSKYTHLIHAATPSTKSTGGKDSDAIYKSAASVESSIFKSLTSEITPVYMHLSSGAVYGAKPTVKTTLAENTPVVGTSSDVYAKTKLTLERNLVDATLSGAVLGTNPRLFSFAGPGIALDDHFAVGNFMAQAIKGGPVSLIGNPETMRTYLHPVDMTHWLVAALANPSLETTHVGSEIEYTMEDIAKIIALEFGVKVDVRGNSSTPPNFYLPRTSQTRKRLNVGETILLPEAISRWRRWLES
jgi:nucleoside-diphosphate-sugar epimerase